MAMLAREATSHESTSQEEKVLFSFPFIDSIMAAGRSSFGCWEGPVGFAFMREIREMVEDGSAAARGCSTFSLSDSESDPVGERRLLFLDPFWSTFNRWTGLVERILFSLSLPLSPLDSDDCLEAALVLLLDILSLASGRE